MNKWYKDKWKDKAEAVKNETGQVLQIVVDSLNQGQRQKLAKNQEVAELFTRYGVVI